MVDNFSYFSPFPWTNTAVRDFIAGMFGAFRPCFANLAWPFFSTIIWGIYFDGWTNSWKRCDDRCPSHCQDHREDFGTFYDGWHERSLIESLLQLTAANEISHIGDRASSCSAFIIIDYCRGLGLLVMETWYWHWITISAACLWVQMSACILVHPWSPLGSEKSSAEGYFPLEGTWNVLF